MSQKLFATLMMILSVVCTLGSLSLFIVYPAGALTPVRFAWSPPAILLWDTLLCLVFFVQHSGMLRRGFRDRLAGIVPRPYHRAVYGIASSVVLTAVVVLWQPSDTRMFAFDGPLRLAAHAGMALAIAVFLWAIVVLRGVDLFGLAAIKAHLRNTPEAPSEFVIRGPYRWVRHPFYSAAIVLIWLSADLTADRLLFNVLWTAWIYLGATLEEKDLQADIGAPYAEYRRHVPMLIPWRAQPSSLAPRAHTAVCGSSEAEPRA